MIALLLIQAADAPAVPVDWDTLAPMPYVSAPEMTPQLNAFVGGEVAAGRCALPKPADGHYVVRVDVAALIDGSGVIRKTVPHAIACPTVEQYAAGLVTGFARGNLNLRASASGTWYRATIVFDWRG
ncbi:hypothetical protein AB5I39_03800 [Sphingomonas sp. MMS24-J45]|uniref:hypothetical protein n=1 Tax=Sphingomonas sp. MMS24-J45 TaxID=3238806 RepID=UPI00384AF25E